ncbi:hypothetical protein ACRALDRAFT_205866 [Sodiomyces alcalophilus JCM 7366]|uniref:uncharacterized protein n=1 Tax=Sodiomyces alcalophilus JCM 7366 TaxID=591952 RepID=UPI0039B3CA09
MPDNRSIMLEICSTGMKKFAVPSLPIQILSSQIWQEPTYQFQVVWPATQRHEIFMTMTEKFQNIQSLFPGQCPKTSADMDIQLPVNIAQKKAPK